MKINRDVAQYGLELISEERAQQIEDALDKTHGYCPCVPKRYHTEDHLCLPCKDARETKECCCGLYRAIEE